MTITRWLPMVQSAVLVHHERDSTESSGTNAGHPRGILPLRNAHIFFHRAAQAARLCVIGWAIKTARPCQTYACPPYLTMPQCHSNLPQRRHRVAAPATFCTPPQSG